MRTSRCALQWLSCCYFQAPLPKTQLSVVHPQIYLRNEHSPAGNQHHFCRQCYNEQFPEQGCTSSGGGGCRTHYFHPAAAGGVKLPLHTEKLRWKSAHPTNVGITQNHSSIWGVKLLKTPRYTKENAPFFSRGRVMPRSTLCWISPSLLPVWDTPDAIPRAYPTRHAYKISSGSLSNWIETKSYDQVYFRMQ